MEKFKVFILSTVIFTVEGIRNLLESKYTSVSVISENWEEIFRDLQYNSPDILLIDDYCMNRDEFLILLNNLLKAPIIKPIIILTGSYDAGYIKNLINMGINYIIHKTSDKENIFKAIEAITTRNIYFDDYILRLIFQAKPDNQFNDLSKREIEVLKLVYQRKTNKEIASELFISVKTVENHKEKIKSKLAVKSVKELYSLKIIP